MPMMMMSWQNPYLSAGVLAVVNHVFFNIYPPTGIRFVVPLLLLEPLLLISSHSSYLTIASTFWGSLALSICAYRLSPFHPLAHIPGPKIGKLTKLWDVYVVWRGRRHEDVRRLHERYGRLVRTAPNEISIIDVAAIKPVLGQLPKGPFYTIRAPNNFGSLLLLTGNAHTVRRKRWARGLGGASLREYEESLGRRTRQLVEHLEERKGEVLDFAAWMNFVAIDLMGDFAFGGGIEMMKNPKAQDDPFWELCEHYHRSFTTICQLPWAYNFCTKSSTLSKNMLGMVAFGSKTAAERVARGTTSKDLWYHLMDEAGIEQAKPDLKDVVRDGVLAVLAGTDTSAGVMASLFYCLLQNPRCYKRAQEEADKVALNEIQVLGAAAQPAYPYVTACINEALRMYPPLPTNGPREVPVGSGGHMVADIMVPEGTQIYLPLYSLHRNPLYFPEPEVFKPERWLSQEVPVNRDAFIPFSYGYANCVGKQLAMQEMLTLTVALLARFEVRFNEGFEYEGWEAGLRDYFNLLRPRMEVVVTPR